MKIHYGIGALCLIGLLLVAAQEQTAAVKVHPQNDPKMPDPTSIPESTPGKPREEAALAACRT